MQETIYFSDEISNDKNFFATQKQQEAQLSLRDRASALSVEIS